MSDQRHYGFDYDDEGCGNCGGEGFVYGCSWDWQCDTYDEGEGTCLCTRRCDWCNPGKPDPALQAVLAEALAQPIAQKKSHPTKASGHDGG